MASVQRIVTIPNLDYSKREKIIMLMSFSFILAANVVLSSIGIVLYDKLTKLLKQQSPDASIPSSATSERNMYIAMLVLAVIAGSLAIAAATKKNAYSTVNATTVTLNITSAVLCIIVIVQGALLIKMHTSLVNQMDKATRELAYNDGSITDTYEAGKAFFIIGLAVVILAIMDFFFRRNEEDLNKRTRL